MKRILVTGGAGFIGQRTCRALLSKGYEVRVLDRLTAPVHANGSWPSTLEATERIVGDVRSRDDWRRALGGVSEVIHLAAYQDYLPDFSTFMSTNATGTALLFEVIVSERLPIERVVIASSQAVYGEGRYRCAEHGDRFPDARSLEQLRRRQWEIECRDCRRPLAWMPTAESHVNPQNAYGISKLTQELIGVHLGRRYGIPTVALRYSITQGAGQSMFNAYSGICRIFASCVLSRRPLPVYEDGGQRRDYVYVDDVVAANLLALEDARTDYDVFNVGGQEAITVIEYARLVGAVAGQETQLELAGRFRVGDTRHIVSDSSKLAALGWHRTTGLEQIIAEYLTWLAHQDLPERLAEQAVERMLELGVVGTAG